MALFLTNRWTLRGIILGVAVLFWANGTSAQAGCDAHTVLNGTQARAEQESHHRAMHPGRDQRKPCNGPTCSKQSPASPVIPTQEPPRKLGSESILTEWLDSLVFADKASFPLSSCQWDLPSGHPMDVLDPPRA